MFGLGDYIWGNRVDKYCDDVFTSIRMSDSTKVMNRKYSGNKRKLINRCEKVNWEKMDEVRKIKGFEIRSYLIKNENLFERLYKLEYGTGIFSGLN